MRGTRTTFALGALLLAVFAAVLLRETEIGRMLLTGRWSYVDRTVVDRGTFFRMKVSLAYKGEAQDFDYVVGCNVKLTVYKGGGGTSYEAGTTPQLYGRAMRDGKGLVVRTPDACGGQTTENGLVPSGFIPIIVVYEDAKLLTFGTAYISDDAYKRPSSDLRFHGATIHSATVEDFLTFRSSSPVNIVSREQYFSAQGPTAIERRGLLPPQRSMALQCHGFGRLRLSEAGRAELRKYWPESRPRFWSAGRTPILQIVENSVQRPYQSDDGSLQLRRSDFVGDPQADNGAPTFSGTTGMGPPDNKYYSHQKYIPIGYRSSAYYPYRGAMSAFATGDPRVVADTLLAEPHVAWQKVAINSDSLGLAYCFMGSGLDFTVYSRDPEMEAIVKNITNRKGIAIAEEMPIENAEGLGLGGLVVFMERDEFIYRRAFVSIDSHSGDL